jgi:hypothetical protein
MKFNKVDFPDDMTVQELVDQLRERIDFRTEIRGFNLSCRTRHLTAQELLEDLE